MIYIILFCLFSILSWAQSNIRVNNFWEDTYFINPAAIHPYPWQFSLAWRKQWTGYPGAPQTGFLTGTYYADKHNTQMGVSIVEDNIGYTNTINAKVSYSYLTRINSFWDLRFGAALCGQNRYYDFTQITTDNTLDPAIDNALQSVTNVNADLGFEVTHDGLLLGLSGQNLVSLFDKNNDLYVNTNFLYASYRVDSRNYMDYSFGLAAIESQNVFQMEANANFFFKISSPYTNAYTTGETFRLGFYYRTWNEIGFLLGIDLSPEWHLSYAYDYNFSEISQESYGTHEVILRYRILPCMNCTNSRRH